MRDLDGLRAASVPGAPDLVTHWAAYLADESDEALPRLWVEWCERLVAQSPGHGLAVALLLLGPTVAELERRGVPPLEAVARIGRAAERQPA